jgi:SAM-dependent methyltransferase
LNGCESSGQTAIVDFAPSTSLSTFIRNQITSSNRSVTYRTADYSGVGVDDKVDITDLRIYGDGQFDFFVCSHVLEHVTDDRKAMKELYRILKLGGKGILMVPIILSLDETTEDPEVTDPAERWRRFGQDDHCRLYSKDGFIQRAEQAGFKVHQYGREYFGETLFLQTGITGQSVLYVVEK